MMPDEELQKLKDLRDYARDNGLIHSEDYYNNEIEIEEKCRERNEKLKTLVDGFD